MADKPDGKRYRTRSMAKGDPLQNASQDSKNSKTRGKHGGKTETKEKRGKEIENGESSNIFATTSDGIAYIPDASNLTNLGPHSKITSWKVINYQIPVPIGDCSAHFLVDADTRHVHKAFLMDGGTNAGNYAAWAQILKGLRFIDLELGNNWTFDSWVVTHWDEDHFRGVKDLLVNPGIKFTRCKRKGGTITKSDPESFASLYFSPKSVLCCGAWDIPVMFKGGGDFLHPFVKENEYRRWDGLDAKERSKQGKKLLRCIWGENLIGLDLFTRSFQFNRNTGNLYKDEPLLRDVPETFSTTVLLGNPETIPRFCVVGANGYGIGRSDACKPEPKRNETSILALLYWPDKQLCSYYTGGDGHTDVYKDHVYTWFIDRWHDVEMVKLDHHGSTGENLGKVPHAENKSKDPVREVPSESDTESESEMAIENLETPDDLEIEVTSNKTKAVKNAEEIGIVVGYMKPSKVFVTPGTRHGHPTWDVLIILRDYFSKLWTAIDNQYLVKKETQGLFSTRSVYWFSKEKVSYKDINFKHVLGVVLQNRLKIAGGDGSGMPEEEDNQGLSYIDILGQDMEEEDSDADPSFDVVTAQIADAPERIKPQEAWAKWRKKLVRSILREIDSKVKYYTKSGRRRGKAINLAVATALEEYDQKRRKNIPRERWMKGILSKPGTRSYVLEHLLAALDELTQATDDAQLEGVENFEEICWQPLVASEQQDPHFLVRFEFGDQRQDTTIKVFDDSGRYEYEYMEESEQDNKEGGMEEEGKQEKIRQRCKKTETKLFSENQHEPWTKHVYGDSAIASMLSATSLGTVANSRMAARIRKSTKKIFTKGDSKNMIYKYYVKHSKAGIEEMIIWNEQNKHKSTNRNRDDENEESQNPAQDVLITQSMAGININPQAAQINNIRVDLRNINAEPSIEESLEKKKLKKTR
ncbi:hypothetical protein H0G86_009755 [Trichoderma simmonsii]|uniref:Metallo-beta-lactamase domain-containing protein n=1 Tax=Trichoderma simmonsii TaxID=1491479 RepID=A0A8G0LL45_9HYPO|nr:hypothetical protein H0G86_009755 [Trichoderma simmonsii]